MLFRRLCVSVLAGFVLASSVFAADAQDATVKPESSDIVIPSTETQAADANSTSAKPAEEQKAVANDAAPSSNDAAAPVVESKKVNLNHANAKELGKVKGMSAYRARQLVAYRKKHGDFKTMDDLKNVKGFSKVSADQMKQIQDQLTLE